MKSPQGVHKAAVYLYKKQKQTCLKVNAERKGQILGYERVQPNNEEAMKIALNRFGPLFVVISVGKKFIEYASGVLDIPNCSKATDHAVVIVGYGTENGEDYWCM
jgi:hypothetical protein